MQERAEQEIRAGKERAEILLAEVNHRVANSLALWRRLSACRSPVMMTKPSR